MMMWHMAPSRRLYVDDRAGSVHHARWLANVRLFSEEEAFHWAYLVEAAVTERKLARSQDDDEQVELLRELAELRSGHLEDPGGAIRALEDLLGLRPADVAALESLVELRADVGDHRGVADALSRLAEVQTEDEASAATLRRLGMACPEWATSAWLCLLVRNFSRVQLSSGSFSVNVLIKYKEGSEGTLSHRKKLEWRKGQTITSTQEEKKREQSAYTRRPKVRQKFKKIREDGDDIYEVP